MPNRKDTATLLDIHCASLKVIQFQQGISRIDLEEVWKTSTTDIPVLLPQLNPLIPQLPHSEG